MATAVTRALPTTSMKWKNYWCASSTSSSFLSNTIGLSFQKELIMTTLVQFFHFLSFLGSCASWKSLMDRNESAENSWQRDSARVGIGHCGKIGWEELPETMNDKMGLSNLVMVALELLLSSLCSQRRVPVLDCSWLLTPHTGSLFWLAHWYDSSP